MNISYQIFDMNIICEECSPIYLNIHIFATLFNKVFVDIVKIVLIQFRGVCVDVVQGVYQQFSLAVDVVQGVYQQFSLACVDLVHYSLCINSALEYVLIQLSVVYFDTVKQSLYQYSSIQFLLIQVCIVCMRWLPSSLALHYLLGNYTQPILLLFTRLPQ